MRGLVPKKAKHRRLRGDWSLKTPKQYGGLKFHFTSICNVLPCELRLFWYSTGVVNRHLANKLQTCGQQSADCWQKIFVKDSRPTIGRQSPTVIRLWANCGPTVGRLWANSFLGELFFTFSVHFTQISESLHRSRAFSSHLRH